MKSLINVLACASLAFCAISAVAADAPKVDPTGTWTWSSQGRGGGDPIVTTLKLKLDGDKLTGKISLPGRGGGAATEADIQGAKLTGDQISFLVVRDLGGNSRTNKYEGKISGDSIKGTQERPARGGGDPTKTDWEAKREAAKK